LRQGFIFCGITVWLRGNHFHSNGPEETAAYIVRGDFVNTDQQNDWRTPYQAALLELDPAKLPERIEQAYKAILTHMDLAHQNSYGAEHQALADALANLRVLRREVVPANRQEPESPAPAR
jgi:hypothetical protein